MRKSKVLLAAIVLTALLMLVPAYSSVTSDASTANDNEQTTNLENILGMNEEKILGLTSVITEGAFYATTESDGTIISEVITIANGEKEMLPESLTFESGGKYIVESGGAIGINMNVDINAEGEIFNFMEGSTLYIYTESESEDVYLYTYYFDSDTAVYLDGTFVSSIEYNIATDNGMEATATVDIYLANGTVLGIDDIRMTSNGVSSIKAEMSLTIPETVLSQITEQDYMGAVQAAATDSPVLDLDITISANLTIAIDDTIISYEETDAFNVHFEVPSDLSSSCLTIEGSSDISMKSGSDISVTSETDMALNITCENMIEYLRSLDSLETADTSDLTPYIEGEVSSKGSLDVNLQEDAGSIVIKNMDFETSMTIDSETGCVCTSQFTCDSIEIKDEDDQTFTVENINMKGDFSINADWVPGMIDVLMEYYETGEFDIDMFISALEEIVGEGNSSITIGSISTYMATDDLTENLVIENLKATGEISFSAETISFEGSLSIGSIEYTEIETYESETYEYNFTLKNFVLEGTVVMDSNDVSEESDLLTFEAEISIGNMVLNDNDEMSVSISNASMAVDGTINYDSESSEYVADMTANVSIGDFKRTISYENEGSVTEIKNLKLVLVFNDVDIMSLMEGDWTVLYNSLDVGESSITADQIQYSVHNVTLTAKNLSGSVDAEDTITLKASSFTMTGNPDVSSAKTISVNLKDIEIVLTGSSLSELSIEFSGSTTINYMDGSSMTVSATDAVISLVDIDDVTYFELESGSVEITTSGGPVDIGMYIAVADGAELTMKGTDLEVSALYVYEGADIEGAISTSYYFVDEENGYDLDFSESYYNGCLPQITYTSSEITVEMYPNTGYSVIDPYESGVTYTVDSLGVATVTGKLGAVTATATAIEYALIIDGTQYGLYTYGELVELDIPVIAGAEFICYKDTTGKTIGNIYDDTVYFYMPAEDYSITTVWGNLVEASAEETVVVDNESFAFGMPTEEGTYMFKLSNGVMVEIEYYSMDSEVIRFTAEKWNEKWSVENAQVYSMDLIGAYDATVYIPVSMDNPTVYHVDEYGRIVEVFSERITIDGVEYAVFDADEFSFYFVADNQTSNNNTLWAIAAAIVVIVVVVGIAAYYMHKKKASA
ncbi:MAG: hypothetical protein KRP56_05305 [Candidatus Methanogranum gryphiswaldense]|nr:MAG: hypothetical protein KRP56_05305 [Candidatus Methanogranum sp. U3.2.1]